MSLTTTDQIYARRLGTLWRDTGLHVLALREEDASDVVVLGGGSAVLWRMLEQPVTLGEVLDRLESVGEQGPDPAEVAACLDDLVTRGLAEGIAGESVA